MCLTSSLHSDTRQGELAFPDDTADPLYDVNRESVFGHARPLPFDVTQPFAFEKEEDAGTALALSLSVFEFEFS